jgi:hypothetical protein
MANDKQEKEQVWALGAGTPAERQGLYQIDGGGCRSTEAAPGGINVTVRDGVRGSSALGMENAQV